MSEAVVDRLEVVEVAKEHGDVGVGAAMFQGGDDALAKDGAVGETGERVLVASAVISVAIRMRTNDSSAIVARAASARRSARS